MNINRDDLSSLQSAYSKVITESSRPVGGGYLDTNDITHSVPHNTRETWDAFLKAFDALHPNDQSDLSGCAHLKLKGETGSEPNKNQTTTQIYKWFKEYGSLDAEVMDELRNYYM